jgi:galactose oxidase-like protein/glyoxal oxidase-like protein
MWSGTVSLPIVPVHSALLRDGRILMSDGQFNGSTAIVWDPIGNTTISAPVPANIFCGAMEQMGDGRILVAGGHVAAHTGLAVSNVFNPSNNSWTVLPNMAQGRWYPTLTILPDGRLIVTSGETNCNGCFVQIQEAYDPSKNKWSQLYSPTLSFPPFTFPYYPHVYVLPDGRILVAATDEDPIVSQVLDLKAGTWTAVGGSVPVDGGSSAMYLPNKILKVGTSIDPDTATRPSVPTAYVLDMTQPSPLWRQVASMAFPRTYHTATLLPDGNVLVTGGGTTTGALDVSNAVFAAELWSPTAETWTTLGTMNAPRLYHSEALLLPDARVLVCGGGRFDVGTVPTDQFSAEFFSPPYLFRGSRPTITSAPSQLSYGQSFTVNYTVQSPAHIAQVSLIRFGGVTHGFNMSQRFLPLSFVDANGSLNITAPTDANLAPPGYYMLFLVDSNGVPSVAAVTHF